VFGVDLLHDDAHVCIGLRGGMGDQSTSLHKFFADLFQFVWYFLYLVVYWNGELKY
jgi:hypothetical protein